MKRAKKAFSYPKSAPMAAPTMISPSPIVSFLKAYDVANFKSTKAPATTKESMIVRDKSRLKSAKPNAKKLIESGTA